MGLGKVISPPLLVW